MFSLQTIIVIDLEATCWKGHPPAGMISEIIEIGAVKIDLSKDDYPIEKCQELIVRPKRSNISPFCTELTSITQEKVDSDGIYLDQACKILNEFAEKCPWTSWGLYDYKFLKGDCKRKKVDFPLSDKYFNLKTLFSVLSGHKKEFGMAKALDNLGLKMDGTHHRGIDDAYNTARILRHLVKQFRSND